MEDDERGDEILRKIEEEIAEQRRQSADAAAEEPGFYGFFDGSRRVPRTDEYPVTNGAGREMNGTFAMLPERRFYADGRDPVAYEKFYEFVRKMAFLEKRARGPDIAVALMAVKTMRKTVDAIEHEAIAMARARLWSWRTIGSVLGISGSALHERYAQPDVRRRKRPKRAT